MVRCFFLNKNFINIILSGSRWFHAVCVCDLNQKQCLSINCFGPFLILELVFLILTLLTIKSLIIKHSFFQTIVKRLYLIIVFLFDTKLISTNGL